MESCDDWLQTARLKSNKTMLIEDIERAKSFHEETVLMHELLRRIYTKKFFNLKTGESINLEKRCLTIAKEELESKRQRLTTLQTSFARLSQDSETKPENQSFKLRFG
jgi:hypothetical protein